MRALFLVVADGGRRQENVLAGANMTNLYPRILYLLPSLSYPMSSPYNTANTTLPVDEHWGVKLRKKCVVGCVSCEKTQCDGFAAQIYKSKTSFRLSFSRGEAMLPRSRRPRPGDPRNSSCCLLSPAPSSVALPPEGPTGSPVGGNKGRRRCGLFP
jgi:hypothetical protein